jgi:putative transposase
MPWKEVSAMQERLRFVQDVYQAGWSMVELCRRYDISRKTGYATLAAYAAGGPAALTGGSHRPRSCPHATSDPVIRLILQLQQRYTWGARKVRRLLRPRVAEANLPSIATVHRILVRHGRVQPRRRSRRRAHPGRPLAPMDHPNAVWSADFKGQFRTGNGAIATR